MIRGLSQFVSDPFVDEQPRSTRTAKNQEIENLTVQPDFGQSHVRMFEFAGLQRRAQLEALLLPRTNLANVPKATAANVAFLAAANKTASSNQIDEETKRILENYRRQVKPSEIKGAPPPEGGKTSGHANPKHRVKPEVQAQILNKPDRIFSGINDNGRFVDIYHKNGSVVITEFGKKDSVITAYGLIDQRSNIKPKPVNPEKFASNPRYVEIVLEEKGATNVVYPNKPRFDADDFPKNSPKPETPKTNSGSSGGNPPATSTTTGTQKPAVTSEPPVAPTVRTPPKDAPVPKSLGSAANNIARGIILLQLVQLGLAAHDITKLKADGEKFGYYVDPFFNKYVLTDPDKAAQNLPEGFELKFFPDPKDHFSTGQSITFQVKDGKFVNIDKNYPDYQLYIGADGLVTAGIIA